MNSMLHIKGLINRKVKGRCKIKNSSIKKKKKMFDNSKTNRSYGIELGCMSLCWLFAYSSFWPVTFSTTIL